MMSAKVISDTSIQMCKENVSIEDFAHSKIAEEGKDDAFHICDVDDIVKKVQSWKNALPQIQPFYAMKCNPDLVVVKLLASLGINFDCASQAEIKCILDLGIEPDRIVFANTCKKISHIKYAEASGIRLMTFDNEAELHKVKQHHPHADLIIRIKVDDSKSVRKLGIKFGCEPEDARGLLKVAWNLGLNVVGVSFHVGSKCGDASVFYEAVKLAIGVFQQGDEVGYKFKILDIGGGFPGHSNAKISFQEVADNLIRGFNDISPLAPGVHIIAEPGRFFVASSFTTVCGVIAMRGLPPSKISSGDRFMYYLNDGLWGSFGNVVTDEYIPLPRILKGKHNGTKLYESSLWGPTCDSVDCISKSIKLPKLSVGDWLVFDNMGAYSTAYATQFNGIEQPVTHYICRNDVLRLKSTLGISSVYSFPSS